jgi:hypothetical protein
MIMARRLSSSLIGLLGALIACPGVSRGNDQRSTCRLASVASRTQIPPYWAKRPATLAAPVRRSQRAVHMPRPVG